jgi:hypothetical protein
MTLEVALVTTSGARVLDEDLPPLEAAMRAVGARTQVVDWHASQVDWGAFDVALLRSSVLRQPSWKSPAEPPAGLGVARLRHSGPKPRWAGQ